MDTYTASAFLENSDSYRESRGSEAPAPFTVLLTFLCGFRDCDTPSSVRPQLHRSVAEIKSSY